jgi:predicted TPR repeat methyltransferase
MNQRTKTDEKARAFFEELWNRGDPWDLETSEFEQAKYDKEISILGDRRYERTLEIGCGIGSFTRRLAAISDRILALDISPTAISRAREGCSDLPSVEFQVQNIIDFDLEGQETWDLVVMSETIYYLGWLYSFFDVAWLAAQLFSATRTGGQLLMANTSGGVDDYLLRPWIIQTYHDLLINVGYELTAENIFHGTKNGVSLDVIISVFTRIEKGQQ